MDNKNEELNKLGDLLREEAKVLRAQVSEAPEVPKAPEAYIEGELPTAPLLPQEAAEETGEPTEKAVGPGPDVTTVQGPEYPL